MKQLLVLATGIAVLVLSGNASGADRMSGSSYGDDKMITNDDLQNAVPGSDNSTFNQMPAAEGSEGSAAGGSKEPDTMQQGDQESSPVDKPMAPAKEPNMPDSGGDTYVMPGY